jgi:hypothetical protein
MIRSTQPANGLTAFSPGRPKPTLCLTSETSGNALPEVFNLTASFVALLDELQERASQDVQVPTLNPGPRAPRTNLVQARSFAIVA